MLKRKDDKIFYDKNKRISIDKTIGILLFLLIVTGTMIPVLKIIYSLFF
jgi:hypothetical protein